jgi:hypothetical protein
VSGLQTSACNKCVVQTSDAFCCFGVEQVFVPQIESAVSLMCALNLKQYYRSAHYIAVNHCSAVLYRQYKLSVGKGIFQGKGVFSQKTENTFSSQTQILVIWPYYEILMTWSLHSELSLPNMVLQS